MRLTDADRERLLAELNAHTAAGRLDIQELELRVAAVIRAQTWEEAQQALGDLATGAATSTPPADPRPRWGHGHGDADGPEPGWRPTAERFRDPRTKCVMRVWEDPAGGRHYLPDAAV